MNQQNLADLIWNVADVLRGDFKQSQYGRIILPFTLLRRMKCVLAEPMAHWNKPDLVRDTLLLRVCEEFNG